MELPGLTEPRDIPVPDDFSRPVAIAGTPYTVTFKDYFTDFALGPHGVFNRSDRPNNPAVAFSLAGPEGTEPFLGVHAKGRDCVRFHDHACDWRGARGQGRQSGYIAQR